MSEDGADRFGDRDPDALLRRAGRRADPDRDQHFLIDDRVLDRLTTYLPAETDRSHVLEVGGGAGGLTDRLLAVAERVTVVERDPAFAAFLRSEFEPAVTEGRLSVVTGDVLETELPPFTASVSNLPYGISSPVTFKLLPAGRPMVLMYQREFAERMAAAPGTDAYGRLSVTAGHYADMEVVEVVPNTAFTPAPAVDSAVLRVTPTPPAYEVPSDELFQAFVTGCFTQRRKTIRNAIRNTTQISGLCDPDALVEVADETLLGKRAGKLRPEDFAQLVRQAVEVGAA